VTIPHLLVAEDDPAISHVLKALLAHGGMSCDVVESALAGLQGKGRLRYSALVIGLGNPGPEGRELIRSSRSLSSPAEPAKRTRSASSTQAPTNSC
jgi:DNA-binding response OmpR family regulator